MRDTLLGTLLDPARHPARLLCSARPLFAGEVSVYDFLVYSHRGTSIDHPHRKDEFPGAVYPNRIPDLFADFVGAEMTAPDERGCLCPWTTT